ncbi:hypothetical protein SAMN05444414_12725 [Roseovarius marisflavi]|uniref:Uncharacterized protein n=1 Tax=Roseovarius marisflavi TaxID=1054996 RepID=A0A1M7CLK2_9RHOB|nr:hypothetical protein SAMN05444414_12725 [Roseovarius marisflavi]
MALLVLLVCLELFGFASHSRGDPLITNDVLYQLSYSGPVFWRYSTMTKTGEGLFLGLFLFIHVVLFDEFGVQNGVVFPVGCL